MMGMHPIAQATVSRQLGEGMVTDASMSNRPVISLVHSFRLSLSRLMNFHLNVNHSSISTVFKAFVVL